jgi:hypothetical protein
MQMNLLSCEDFGISMAETLSAMNDLFNARESQRMTTMTMNRPTLTS